MKHLNGVNTFQFHRGTQGMISLLKLPFLSRIIKTTEKRKAKGSRPEEKHLFLALPRDTCLSDMPLPLHTN